LYRTRSSSAAEAIRAGNGKTKLEGKIMKTILCLGLLLLATTARADSWVYTYTGNQLNGCQCSIDGSFTTGTQLQTSGPSDQEFFSVLTYSFTVDGFTFNPSDSHLTGLGQIEASTDASGDIAEWTISIDAGNGVNLFSQYSGTFQTAEGIQDFGLDVYGYGSGEDYLEANQGSWTFADPSSVPAPEPAPLMLLLVGLSGLLGLKALSRRRAGSSLSLRA
jgi:hypothetical protein